MLVAADGKTKGRPENGMPELIVCMNAPHGNELGVKIKGTNEPQNCI